MSRFYYNTKTSYVVELNEKDYNELNPTIRKKYRPATDAEIQLYEKRKAQQDFLEKKRNERAGTQTKRTEKKGETTSVAKKDDNTEKKS